MTKFNRSAFERSDELSRLLRQGTLWRGHPDTASAGAATVPTGYPALDARLPGGGWPRAALTELIVEDHGRGELRLLMPALARLSREPDPEAAADAAGVVRWIGWIAPPWIPYAPALRANGLDPGSVLWVRASRAGNDGLWAAEQALRSGHCAAVLVWSDTTDQAALRRLQLAAECGDAWAVVFRPSAALAGPTPAALRLHLSADGQLRILKCRRGRPARLSLAALVANAEPDWRQRC